MNCRRVFAWIFWLCANCSLLASHSESDLQNSTLRVAFQPNYSSLSQFTDLKTKWNHLGDPSATLGLWELETISAGEKLVLSPATAKSFKLDRQRRGLQLTWSQFGISTIPNLKVVVQVNLDRSSPLSRWRIAIQNADGLVLEKIHFPRFSNIRSQDNERLAVPVWMGQLSTNPRALLTTGKGNRLEWEYPGHTSLQCLAWYKDQGPGLYFSCDDTDSFRKSFVLWGTTNGQINYEMIHLPETRDSGHYTLPYQAIIGTFQGDWFTAAEQYRSWATNQPWASQSRVSRRLLPDWIDQTGLWVWNRGRSSDVLAPAMALEKELGLPVRVFWHWWHGCAYDTGFPEYLPPREGAESFTNALNQAHQHNLRALVYMNQRLWGMTTKSWEAEGAPTYAVKNAEGKIHPEVYNTFTKQPCASMCMGTPFWRNKYAGLATEAFNNLGVDGIYMDQACSSLACFDPAHGHPLGGGRYWVDGFRLLSNDIRARCNGSRTVALAGEGCGEGWLPFLDLMLALQVSKERYASPKDGWQPIPMFQAVYHPYCVFYGNYSSLTMPPYDDLWPAEFAPKEPLKLLDQKYSQQFYLEQARAFVWGQQPTIANFLPNQLRDRAPEVQYVMQLAKLRMRALPYLAHGTLLRPPQGDVPQATLPISRLSIYAGQMGALTEFEARYPLVQSAAWQAPDGSVAIALASISNEAIDLSFTLDAKTYHLPPRAHIYETTLSDRKPVGKVTSQSVSLKFHLAPREARIVEFVN